MISAPVNPKTVLPSLVSPSMVAPGSDLSKHPSAEQIARLFGKTRQGYDQKVKSLARQATSYDHLKTVVLALVCQIRKRLPRLGCIKILKRIRPALAQQGLTIGRDRFFTMLGEAGLLIYPRRPYHPRTTNSNHWLEKYANLISNIEVTRPNQVWVSDITYIRIEPQFRYLSLISDLYSHKIVGYAFSDNLSHVGPVQALEQALRQRTAQPDGSYLPLIHHSDRGVQYCCEPYVARLKKHQVAISMTENGDPYENAQAERLNGILKYEFDIIQGFQSHELAVRQIKQAIEAYNEERPHASIDYLTPTQAHKKEGLLQKHWKIRKSNSVK